MEILDKDDLDLRDAVEIIALNNDYSPIAQDIAQSIYDNGLCRDSITTVLENHKIGNVKDLKNELLDFIIDYIEIVLNDHIISEKERKNVSLLKRYFKIEEGDFYKLRSGEIALIFHKQFEWIYADGVVTEDEEIHEFEIYGMFDLGYDQFLEFFEKDTFIKETYHYFSNRNKN